VMVSIAENPDHHHSASLLALPSLN
jgi:hypothetical protein